MLEGLIKLSLLIFHPTKWIHFCSPAAGLQHTRDPPSPLHPDLWPPQLSGQMRAGENDPLYVMKTRGVSHCRIQNKYRSRASWPPGHEHAVTNTDTHTHTLVWSVGELHECFASQLESFHTLPWIQWAHPLPSSPSSTPTVMECLSTLSAHKMINGGAMEKRSAPETYCGEETLDDSGPNVEKL